MSFVSLQFIIMVFLTVLIYYICPKKYRWYVLLASSCYFYIFTSGSKAFVIALITIFITYLAALRIERPSEKRKKKKLYLTCGIIVILGLWIIFKIKNHIQFNWDWLVVPLGVSYYSFSLIGYLADIYFQKDTAEKNPLKLLLYTLYFPKIMQGPISKFRDISIRLLEGHNLNYCQLCFGLQLMLWGYFKKIVIADRAAFLTETVFGCFSEYDSGGAILLIVTFIAVIRHYCDFSGYMDIVIGISQIMGIKLENNFKQPFFSKNSAEFWRRWHITLGTWFKDYVYMPLVINPKVIRLSGRIRKRFGKRAGKSVLTVVPLAIVWILTGLWHGTGLSYILWGIYWGSIIIISNVFSPEFNKITKILRINTHSQDWKFFQIFRTFFTFMIGLLLSTLVGYKNLGYYLETVIRNFDIDKVWRGEIYSLGLDKANFVVLIVSIIILWFVEAYQQKGSVREMIASQHPLTRWSIYALAFITIVFFGIYGAEYDTNSFAYAFF